MSKFLQLKIKLPDDWKAAAEVRDAVSSIVLITFTRSEQQGEARLDLGKGMFIDKPPLPVSREQARSLAEGIAEWIEKHAETLTARGKGEATASPG